MRGSKAGIGRQHGLGGLGPVHQTRRSRSARARCGPRPAACPAPSISPSAGNSGATAWGRRPPRHCAAPRPPRVRHGSTGGGHVCGRRHLAPAVVDFLFLGQRVVNAGEQLDIACRNTTASARAAASRLVRSASVSRFSVASRFSSSSSPATVNISPAMVSSNSLFQADGAHHACVVQDTFPSRRTAGAGAWRACGRTPACSGQDRRSAASRPVR